MSVKTAANRFIVPSFGTSAGFYQQLAASALTFQELGNKLIRYAEQARAFRQTERVREFGLMLANLPSPQFQTASHYYLGWALYRSGERERAKTMLEQVAESGTRIYQARSLLSLGTLEAAKQDFTSEARYYLEAFKASHDLSTEVEALRGMAVIKAKEGYHKSSVKDFEEFLSLAMNSDALTYNLYISSLAVELGEVGRIQEARNISKIVINSPFTFAYPEWQETANELKPASRSFVAFKPSKYIPQNVLAMPEREQEPETRQESQPARVFSLQQWKKKMARGKKNNDKKRKPLEEMTTREMLIRVLDVFSDENLTDEQIRRMLAAAEKAALEPDEPASDE